MAISIVEYVRDPNSVWNLPTELVAGLRTRLDGATLVSPRDETELERALPGADVMLGWGVRERNFAHAPRLKWVHVTAAGVKPLLFPAMVASDVVITNSRGLHADSMAEHALALLLAFARKLHLARDAQHDRRWTEAQRWSEPVPFTNLAGATLGLVGLGAIGGALARRARALGMRVIAVRRRPAEDPAPADVQWGTDRLVDMLAAADAVVLAAPATPETRHLIGGDRLARMRPHAILINLGRGSLVDEPALIEALRAGRIAGAGLDVFEREPLPPDSPLWAMPQVIVTPHVAGLGPRYWERALDIFADNFARFRDGRPLVNVVDKQAGY